MAHKALDACGLPCDLLRSGDVRSGRLQDHDLLFVPGGWASNKAKALGEAGVAEIRRFVRDGGSYLGFCGGAGLATEDGIGLLPVRRMPTKERVPSFSGRIGLALSKHPLWEGIADPVFHAWWPSQFLVDGPVNVLAAYAGAMPDAFSSDVNVGDAEAAGKWAELERMYRINLDPKRLSGEPAVIEARYGEGRVLLSLIHFDTPGDRNGMTVLKNIWKYLDQDMIRDAGFTIHDKENSPSAVELHESSPDAAEALSEIESAVADLINLGARNFLWFRRSPMLLQWRRGVRGLEYCTLSVMVGELAELLGGPGGRRREIRDLSAGLLRIRELLLPFVAKSKQLLVRERYAMQKAPITYERCDDGEILTLREELFSRTKSHGGLFKELVDEIDRLLYSLLTSR
jgi:putative intracellular protease/amidase